MIIAGSSSAQHEAATTKIVPIQPNAVMAKPAPEGPSKLPTAKKTRIFIQLGKAHLVQLPNTNKH